MRIRIRRIWKWLAIPAVLIPVILLILLQTRPGQQWLLRRAENMAAAAGVPFTARNLALDLWNLRASLEDISLDMTAASGVSVTARRLAVDVPWSILRADVYEITNLEIDDPVIAVRAVERASEPDSGEAASIPRFRFLNLAVRNGSFSYTSGETAFSIPEFSVEIAGDRGTIRIPQPAAMPPDLTAQLPEIPLALTDSAIQFGPMPWSVVYTGYGAQGSAQGRVQWAPAIAADLSFQTDPLEFDAWTDIELSGAVQYADDLLKVTDFRGRQGDGEIRATAELGSEGGLVNALWSRLNVDPSGIRGVTDGMVDLRWTAADFSDAAGTGTVSASLPDYANLKADITMENGVARVALDANPAGTKGPRWRNIDATGTVSFRDGILKVQDLEARQGAGRLTAAAELSRDSNSVNAAWSRLGLDPAGVQGTTDGAIELRWKAPDFSDSSGSGRVTVNAPEYGKADSRIAILNGRATLDLQAAAYEATLAARATTGLDKTLGGTFAVSHQKYGPVTLQGNLGGTWANPLVTALFEARGVRYEDYGPADASASIDFRDNVLSVAGITAVLKRTRLENAFARVDLNSRQVAAEIPATTVFVDDITPQAAGRVVVSAMASGTIENPAAQLTAESDGLDVGGTHIDTVSLSADYLDDVVTLNRLSATQSEGRLEATGDLNVRSELVHAAFNVRNLQIVDISGLSAAAFFDGTIDGMVRQPQGQGKGEIRDIVYEGQEHGNLALELTADTVTGRLRAHSDKYDADIASDVRLEAPYEFTAGLTARQTKIQYQQYNVEADGSVEAEGSLQPFILRGVRTNDFKVRGEGVELTASGPLDTGMKVDVTADLAELPVEGVLLAGTAEGHATVSGTIENPVIEGSLHTTNATIQAQGMTEPASVAAQVDFSGDRYTIVDMKAGIAGAAVTVTGSGDLKGAGSFEFKAENIRPENLLADRPVTGLLAAEGSVSLTQPSLDGLTGSIRVTELQASVQGIDIQESAPIEAAIANKILTVNTLELKGSETNITGGGTLDLESLAMNFNVDADTNLRLVEAFVPDSTVEGRLQAQVRAGGSARQPDIRGFVTVSEAAFQAAQYPVDLDSLNARIEFTGDRIEIVQGQGNLNGGELSLTGGAGLSSAGLRDAAVSIKATDIQLEYPEGLESEMAADLNLTGTGEMLSLQGTVDVNSALYRNDIDITQQVFSRITNAADVVSGTPSAGGMAEKIRLDVTVRTPGLITITNNLANLDLDGTFQIRGNLTQPVVLGRASVTEGGELYFGPGVSRGAATGDRRDRYIIERGTVEFNDPIRTTPTLDFEATHELVSAVAIQGQDRFLITLRVLGTPADLKTELSSDPPVPERDIIAMLLTGRPLDQIQREHAAVAREQVANYLSGQLSGFFGNAGTALGLDTVRLDPVTLASEEDLSAQLTLGKQLTRSLGLTFSQNLKGTRSQTWIADYNTFRNFTVRAVNEASDRTIRLEFRQDIRIGGGPPLPRRVEPQAEQLLGEVTFMGTSADPEALQDKVTKPGKPFNLYRLNSDVRKLKEYFSEMDLLDVRVRARRSPVDDRVDVAYQIEEGPRITFAYEGAKVSGRLQDEIKQIWIDGFAEASSIEASVNRLLKEFRDDGYLQAQVTHRDASASDTEKHFVFTIAPGMKFDDPEWVFTGIEPLDIPDSPGDVLATPEAVRDRIQFELQKKGFLAAEVSEPALAINGKKSTFEVSVNPGPQFVVAALEFEGNSFFTPPHLQYVVVNGPTEIVKENVGARPPETEEPLEPFPFTSEWIETARQRVTAEYWQQGFNDLQLEPTTRWEKDSGRVVVHFKVTEGERQMIEDVRIDGVVMTDMKYVLRQFAFSQGDPVDYGRINLTRKKLYDTGLFKRVDIDVVAESTGYTTNVSLNEEARWRMRYGFSAANRMQTSDRELGITSDITRNNIFGRGIAAGLSVKGLRNDREARLFGTFPTVFGREVRSTASVARQRLFNPEKRDAETDEQIRKESTDNVWRFTAQQQWRLENFYILTYDFTYLRQRSSGPEIDPSDLSSNYAISRFNGTLSRDTRDDILNATRGNFLSGSLEFAVPALGSDFQYVKQYTQFFKFKPVKKNLVWATGIRAGVLWNFGRNDISSTTEQFLAGGGTTLRAFAQDELTEAGGNALLILNQELRFPLLWRFGGVAFVDAGNIYRNVGGFRAWDLRYSPGFGLRLNTPIVLLRLDVGFNLWGRAGEPPRRLVFGIGQAF